jgi:sugar transferase EpsL
VRDRAYERSKRCIDVAVAGGGLVVLSPVLALVAIAVRMIDGPPVLFRQLRPGRDGRPFTILKFRTMDRSGAEAGPSSDGGRLTPLGRFLRETSLDEFPELVNVLRGEMSLVGPRPLLMQYLDRYTEAQARRHDVPPGVTGWVQVNGRNALTWDEKLALDVWYVEHRSLSLDLRILIRTLARVWRREGITHPGSPTMDEFMGSASGTRGAPGTPIVGGDS